MRFYRVKHGNQRTLAAQGVVNDLLVRIVEPPKDDTTKILDQLASHGLQYDSDKIRRMLSLLQLVESIQDMIAREEIALSKAYELAKLPASKQREVAMRIVDEQLTLPEVRLLVQQETGYSPASPGDTPAGSSRPDAEAVTFGREHRCGPLADLAIDLPLR